MGCLRRSAASAFAEEPLRRGRSARQAGVRTSCGSDRCAYMRNLLALLVIGASPVVAMAQSVATLRVTVVDASTAVIVGAQVDVTPAAPIGAAAVSMQTGGRGE